MQMIRSDYVIERIDTHKSNRLYSFPFYRYRYILTELLKIVK